MKKIISLFILTFLIFSGSISAQKKGFYENVQKKNINKLLDDLNVLAANAEFEKYFECFAEESQYIGTDATEVWTKKEFKDWSKPYFDKKTTWNFKSLKRNIFFSKDGNYAWFDEILDTQMKICRGSGVVEKINGKWKIRQYVLSVTVPNDVVDEVTKIKAPIEDALIQKLK
ncbi:nuclear transport factor 2 family protein [Epilithonimonas xixisoli]|uniref:SnoaL-like protein n=1 Tax=Epilithonimonas xixisoli TaxID=1476462 RepID=A0A4R8IE90_9FLAO|nr:nuclear transport factor 2 family protein [Epilithonimonas xixisoli]TDX83125.1 SnoaL-like protein [Epilithonimonas xixisoli]